MSKFEDYKSSPMSVRMTLGPLARPVDTMRFMSIHAFEQVFSCRINSLPQNVCLMGWIEDEQCWYCAPEALARQHSTHVSHTFHTFGTKTLLAFLSERVMPQLEIPSIWFPYCFYDAWRERTLFSPNYRWVVPPDMTDWTEWRGEAGEVPIVSPTRHWVMCQGAHRDDPSACVVVDAHYLTQNNYVELFSEVESHRIVWANKRPRAVLAGADHGENANFFVPAEDATLNPRRLIRNTVASQSLAVDVYLGRNVSLAEQLAYRYIIDADGYARTWSAWAWKMMSGSTVLSLESPWTAFFTEQFSPWEHFVPIANDCSDLAEKLDWCRNNDFECQEIASRARDRAMMVYDVSNVTSRMIRRLRESLAEPFPAGWPATL